MSSHRRCHQKKRLPPAMAGHVTTVGLLGMKAHQLFVHHVRMFYIWHPKYITVVRLKWSSLCSFNKHMGQTAQVRKGPEMNLPRLPCRHPSIQENASIGFRWFQPLRMVSSVFVLQACFLSKLWVKAEQRSAHGVILLGTRFPALVKLQYDTMYPLQPRNPNIPYFFVCQVRVSPSMAEK